MVRPLSASDLLALWEHGAGRLPVEQGFLLLRAACPDIPAADLARLPIGQRDAALMSLRQQTFGSPLNGLAVCPACGERVEIGFPLEDLFAAHQISAEMPPLVGTPQTYRLSTDDHKLVFRLPTSADLMDAASAADPASARLALIEACLLEAHREGQPVLAADLPAEVTRALSARMEQADPLANLSLPLDCPACAHGWEVTFDIVSFLWAEISAWAERLLREVHGLASAYGWREADILSMSAQRRQMYLDLVGA
jgi:hypothetical protein